MSFFVLKSPRLSPHLVAEAPVTVAFTVPKRGRPRLRLTLRPWLIQGAPDWLAYGKQVGVEVGLDEHAGMVKIVEQGDFCFQLAPHSGKPSRRPIVLALPPFAGLPEKPQEPTPASVTAGSDLVIVSLPSWARAPAQASAPKRGPFSMGGPTPEQILAKGHRQMRGTGVS